MDGGSAVAEAMAGRRRNGTAFTAAGHGRGRSPARENAEGAEKGGAGGKARNGGTE